jgi:nitrate reductase gamma subunit
MNAQESDRSAIKRSYLFDTLGVYFGLMAVLILVIFIILSLPYDNTYIRESGVSDYYIKVFAVMAAATSVILIVGLFYNAMIWMEGEATDDGRDLTRSRKLLISASKLGRAIFSRDFGKQLKVFVVDSLFLRKLWRISKMRWFMHAMILFGFIGMLVLDLIATAALEIFHIDAFIDPNGWGKLWIRDFGFELFGLMVLIGLVGATIRRFVFRPKQLKTGQEDFLAVVLLLIVVVGGFVQEGIGMTSGLPSHASPDAYSFVGAFFASFLPAVSSIAYQQLWFIHAVASLALIAYIPFSKLFHLFAAPLANQIDEIIRRRENAPAR